MVDDTTKIGILDWLFGKKALDKAAGQGSSTPVPNKPPPQQDNSYLKKAVDEQMKVEKAKKEALDKLVK